MRIAQVAPLVESIPPRLYGGTERIVHGLTEALIDMGHEVTLFAAGDSRTRARLLAPCAVSQRASGRLAMTGLLQVRLARMVLRHAHEFDLIHFHTEYEQLGLAGRLRVPTVTTMHGRQDTGEGARQLFCHQKARLVSISISQQAPVPFANWRRVIYNGLPERHLRFSAVSGDYLVFLGRLSPEKGFDDAVEIARRTGHRLKVAARAESFYDGDYLQSIRHLLNEPHVEYLGEIGDRDKSRLLGGAKALLFPIKWPEPFGLVMIEALACGTPVIAYRNGSVPEIIDDGRTGFIVASVDEACTALTRLQTIERGRCRAEFMRRFTARRMGADYLRLYQDVVGETFAGTRSPPASLQELGV